MKKEKEKIIVGLSGGVDSSVSMLLLKKQGYEPIGVFLDYSDWNQGTNLTRANVEFFSEALNKAKKVCEQLNAPFYKLNCRDDFRKEVINYFLKTLEKKETPNPCVVCNRKLKIKKLLSFASKKKIKYVATGHYARIQSLCHCERPKGAKQSRGKCLELSCRDDNLCEYQLLKGKDKDKDQSYFLCLLGQEELKRLIFPLGDYTKKQVYQIAGKEGFDFLSRQKESQDLCFLSERSIPAFLEQEIGYQPGEIVDTKGIVLGEHKGLHFYTIGQRRGINLAQGPWWVVDFDRKNNKLIVTDNEKDSVFYSKTIKVKDYNFISGQIPKKPIKVEIKPRYQHPAAPATLFPERSEPKRAKSKGLKIVFSKPQKALTPGQWAVFYQKDVCLGGGVIDQLK